MGPIDSPPIPTAWRERPQSPFAQRQVGLELIGRTDKSGEPAIYWGDSHADCYAKAAAAGWQL